MKKYLEVFRLSFKMQIIWRFDVAMTAVGTVGRILAAWILWGAIFLNRQTVSGFSFNAMLSYYIISSFLSSLDMSDQISGEISYTIRDGQFSKHMVTPMNPQGFFGVMVAGEAAFHLFFSFTAALLCVGVFRINLTLTNDPLKVLYAAAMILTGLLFMISFNYFLGILAFKYQNVDGFLYIKGNLISFATGVLVPIAILPGYIQNIMRFLPFYYITYQPAMILAGQNVSGLKMGFVILAVWTAAFLIISQVSYHRFRVKFDGVGI